MVNFRNLIGMGGVPPHDNAAAYLWEQRLHWAMVGVALLALPAFYLELAALAGPWHHLGRALDIIILSAFTLEFLWMMRVVRQKLAYLLRNWLDVMIILGAAISLIGVESEWVPLMRLLRLAYVSLVLARALGAMHNMFSPTAVPYILGWGAVTIVLAGAVFYWLEPTVHSFEEGLWLAFVTGATVGYGDFVPTTTAARVFAVLTVVVGFAMLSLVTATFAAIFIGEDEKKLRHEMHQDIRELRQEVARLRAELAKLSDKIEK